MLHSICQECKKNLYPPYVLPSIIGILFTALAAPVSLTDGQELSIFSLLCSVIQQNPGVIELPSQAPLMELSIDQSSFLLWVNSTSGWLTILAPFLVTFGYLTVLFGERQYQFTPFCLLRSGKWRYCIAKVTGAALSGGFVFLLGYAVFGLLLTAVFPSFSSFPPQEQAVYLASMHMDKTGCILGQLLGAFLYGMSVSTFGIGAAIVFRDQYMLLCLPFLVNYMYDRFLNKLISDDLSGGGNYVQYIEAFVPSAFLHITQNPFAAMGIALMLAVYLCLILLFYKTIQ